MDDRSGPMIVNFKCPNCKQTCGVDEVVTGVTQFSAVEGIIPEGGESVVGKYGLAEYDRDDCDGIARFQCHNCGYILRSGPGSDERTTLVTIEQLMVWLQERGMLSDTEGPPCAGDIRVELTVGFTDSQQHEEHHVECTLAEWEAHENDEQFWIGKLPAGVTARSVSFVKVIHTEDIDPESS